MRHTSKRPRSRTNLPTVAEGAEQSQEESQQQQQQQLQESRSLLSNIFSRRPNSQRNNLASSSSAPAPQNDNGGSGTEAAQGKRKRAMSSLMSRFSSQRSGLTASSAPQHPEADNPEATPVTDGVAPTSSSTTSPTTPQRPGGLIRSASSTSRFGQRIGNSFSNLSQVLPRRRRPTQDDAQPLVGEGEGADDTINDDDLRLDIDPPVHFDGFFRPGDTITGKCFVQPRNKRGEPVIAIEYRAVGVIKRHVCGIDPARPGQLPRPEMCSPHSESRSFYRGKGSRLPSTNEELQKYLRTLGGVIPFKLEVPSTVKVLGGLGYASDARDDFISTAERSDTMPPPSMRIHQRKSSVLRRLGSSSLDPFFKSRKARVKYELRLTVTWQTPQQLLGSTTRRKSILVEFFVQPCAPTLALSTDPVPEGPPPLDSMPEPHPADVRDVKFIKSIDPSSRLPGEYQRQLPWSSTNFCQSGPPVIRLLAMGDSPESPRRLTSFWQGRGCGGDAAAMTLTTDARPAFVTGEQYAFTLGITLPKDAELFGDGNLRMNVMRTAWSRTKQTNLLIETSTLMASLQGGSAVRVDFPRGFYPASREEHDRTYDHYWSGHFVIEPFMLPAYDYNPATPPTASHDTRTVPSFSLKGTHVAYDLVIQVDTQIPAGIVNGTVLSRKRSGMLCRVDNVRIANSSSPQHGSSGLGECESKGEANACVYPPRYATPSPDAIQVAPSSPQGSVGLSTFQGIVIAEDSDPDLLSERPSPASDSTPPTPLPEYSPPANLHPAWEEEGLRNRRRETARRRAQPRQPASATRVDSRPLHRQAVETSAANRAVKETRAESHAPQQQQMVEWTRSQASLAREENRENRKPSPKWFKRLLRGLPITKSKESVRTSSTPPRIDTPPVRVTRSPTPNEAASASASASASSETNDDAAREADSTQSNDRSTDSYGINTVWEQHQAAEGTRNTSEMSSDGHSGSIVSRPATATRHDSSTLGETEPQQADSQSSAAAASASALLNFELRQSATVPAPDALPTTPGRSPAIVQQQDEEQRVEQPTAPVTEPSADPAEPEMKSYFSPETTPADTPQQQDSPHAQPSQPLTAQSSVASLDAQRSSELSQLPAAPRGFTTTSRAPEQITVTQPTPERGVTAGVGTELVWSDAPQHELEPQPSASEAESSQEAEERVPEPAC